MKKKTTFIALIGLILVLLTGVFLVVFLSATAKKSEETAVTEKDVTMFSAYTDVDVYKDVPAMVTKSGKFEDAKDYGNKNYVINSDPDFPKKFSSAPYFCIPHYRAMLDYAQKKMNKKAFFDFYDAAYRVESEYVEVLTGDVSWFCKKFDYRYDEEPWYNSKDSVKRAIKFLSGEPEQDLSK